MTIWDLTGPDRLDQYICGSSVECNYGIKPKLYEVICVKYDDTRCHCGT